MAPGIADIVPVNYAEQAQTNIKSNSRTNPSSEDENSQDDLLISSPYTTAPHLLDLRSLDTPNRLLARALTVLTPIRDDYATAPYLDSFNWTAVFEYLRDLTEKTGHQWTRQTFYVVAFRSILYPDVDGERLGALDAHSHREATESGGLLKYWFGTKNAKRENLATCQFPFLSPFLRDLDQIVNGCRPLAQSRRRPPRGNRTMASTGSRGSQRDVRED